MLNELRILGERILFKKERFSWERDRARWRRSNPIDLPAEDIIVTFFIPIFQKCRSPDWEMTCRLLKRTLMSLRQQSDPRWRAIVCSQDRPEDIDEDIHIKFLHYPISHNGRNDKDPKIRHIARTLARSERRDNYAFFLDGDDIPHRNLVKYILSDNNGIGYALPYGYSLDALKEEVFFHGPEVNYPFTKMCGSSHAVRFDTRKGSAHVLHIALSGMHRYTRENMRERVFMELGEVPFPAMLYLYNHGSSDQDLVQKKVREIDHVPLDQNEATRVLLDFGSNLSPPLL